MIKKGSAYHPPSSTLPFWLCLKSAVTSLSQSSDMQVTMDSECRVGEIPATIKRTKTD